MEFNFLGNKIEINITNKKSNKISIRDKVDRYTIRTALLLITFMFFSVVFNYYKSKNTYNVGDVAKTDIIAYKTHSYVEDLLDKELRDKIYKNTKAVYDRIEYVESVQLEKFERVLKELETIDLKNENEVYNFISKNKLNISVSDLISIGINKGGKYNKYLIDILRNIYDEGILKKSDLNKNLSKKQIILDSYELNLIRNFIEVNLVLNEEKTKSKIDENIQNLKNNIIVIKKGDVIVKKGNTINLQEYDQLLRLGMVNNYDKYQKVIFTIVFNAVVAIFFFITSRKYLINTINSKAFYPSFIVFMFINILYMLLVLKNEYLLFILPVSTMVIVSMVLSKDRLYSVALTMLLNILLSPNLEWFVLSSIISIIAIGYSTRITNRTDIVKNGFKIGALQAIFCIIYTVIYNYDFVIFTLLLTFSLISGFLTAMISLAIIPYFENTFNILTDIKLLEIGDYSSPLLKRLLLEAPGTFYHSMMVGALAEQAAEAIGANPILARVGAYYHDIGKLKRPTYFVENQGGSVNLHDELKPSLSSLILTSHTRDGYILAKNAGLPDEILNMIIEHHGTTMVQFFYYKAVEIGENINETDFRYVGPRPSTKESAIVMLADTVEAAVRASKDKSKEGIENTIRYLVKYKIEDNQLNNCEITLNDIEKIINAFIKVLSAAYHERIQYPKIGRK